MKQDLFSNLKLRRNGTNSMVSPTFTPFDNYALSMLWWSTCFDSTSSDDVRSVHNDVLVWLWLAVFRILYIFSKRGHPRMFSFSVVSFSVLRSSVRYLTIISGHIGEDRTLPHYYLSLWVGEIWWNPSFLSVHCSHSRFILFVFEDFSLVYLLLIPLDP